MPDDGRGVGPWLQANVPMLVGPLLWLIATVVFLIVHGPSGWQRMTLRTGLLYGVGVGAFVAAFGHLVVSDQVAESIGWPAGNPFQLEVGTANLGLAAIGIASWWEPRPFWLATIIAVSVFLVGDAVIHLSDMVRAHNFSPNNAGFVFWWDFALPAILIALYIATA